MTKKRTPSAAATKEEKKVENKSKKPEKVVETVVVQAAPVAPKEPEYVPKPLDLGRKTPSLPTSLGMPKSKKPWKGASERSGKHKKMYPKTWQQKMDDKRRLQSVRERVREEREKVKNSVKNLSS